MGNIITFTYNTVTSVIFIFRIWLWAGETLILPFSHIFSCLQVLPESLQLIIQANEQSEDLTFEATDDNGKA